MSEHARGQPTTRRRHGFGLHLKLVLAAGIATFLSIVIVSVFLVFQLSAVLGEEVEHSRIELQEAVVDRGRLLAESMAASLENAIAGYNFAFVTETIKSVQQRNTAVVYGLVTNTSGVVIVHTDPRRVGSKRPVIAEPGVSHYTRGMENNDLVEISHPIRIGGQVWGNLVLAFDLRPLEQRATEAMNRGRAIMIRQTTIAVAVGLLVMFLGITASLLMSRRLLRPVVTLADDARVIAEGDLDREIRPVDSDDEIGFLARQFERMRLAIKRYIGELLIAKQKAESATREEKRLRSQIEEHSRLLEHKVEERTAELRTINTRLTEYDRLKTEFLNNVSHELRSPLAAISSAAKIITRYGDRNPGAGKKFSSIIIEESKRLSRLINDLLDLAKIEAGRVDWHMDNIDNPAELIAHVVETFRPLASERKVALELDCTTELPAIRGDYDRLLQVLTNLCSNALKFTPEGGRICIAGEEASHEETVAVRISVTDTGPGIPAEELDKVFDRFHQVQAPKGGIKPKGTGLGLAICREVITHHGGEIWAEAAPEGGTRMVLVLPAAPHGMQEMAGVQT